ncbi:somatostatin 1.2 [Polymixia lowei]
MRCYSALFLLALVLSVLSPGVSAQPDREQDLDLELRHHRLLQRARAAGLMSQDWSKREVELLSQLSMPEGDAQQGAEVVSMTSGGVKEDSLRMDLERSVESSNNLPPRERKAGCKNFYWKGFTSC